MISVSTLHTMSRYSAVASDYRHRDSALANYSTKSSIANVVLLHLLGS
jgi:hypothetical protein